MNLKELSKAVGISEPFTKERNEELYQRLIAGDEKARNEMIEGNLALVVYRVEIFLASSPQMSYYRDDLISAGLLGLCKAVDCMRKNHDILKPTGRMTKEIDHYIQHLADESNTIRIPWRTQARARQNGKPIRPPRIISDKVLEKEVDVKYEGRIASAELTEELYACCEDGFEKKILSMRLDYFSDKQIAESLNCSVATIIRARKKIMACFDQRCPEYRRTKQTKKAKE